MPRWCSQGWLLGTARVLVVVSVLSLLDRGIGVETAVQEIWDLLQAVDSVESLSVFKRLPKVTEKLAPYSDDEVLKAIRAAKGGKTEEKPVKQVELDEAAAHAR